MALFNIKIICTNIYKPDRQIELDMKVDNKTELSIINAKSAEELALTLIGTRLFKCKNSEELVLPISIVQFEWENLRSISYVAISDRVEEPILGRSAIYSMGCDVDEKKRKLIVHNSFYLDEDNYNN